MSQPAPDEDARLLAKIAGGDGEAFSVFYRRHLSVVVRWCVGQTGDRELAADLSAEVFAAALSSAGRYRSEQGAAPAWLIGIARNKLLESLRRGRVESAARRRLGLGSVEFSDEDLRRVEELASESGAVLSLVEELPGEQREAVMGRVVEELPYSELARRLRCSELVARKRVSRGLESLRARMEER